MSKLCVWEILRTGSGIGPFMVKGGFKVDSIITSKGFFLGPFVSYRYRWIELYLGINYNSLNWKYKGGLLEDEEKDKEDDLKIDFSLGEGYASYFQTMIGFNIWFTQGFGFNINGIFFSSPFDDDGKKSGFLPTAGLLWRF